MTPLDHSIFMEKENNPEEEELKQALGKTFLFWKEIRTFTEGKVKGVVSEWNYPGAKYGWSFRIKDKKRTVIYLLPRDKFFKVAFVFGQKATDEILAGNYPREIKDELNAARVYAEGRGIRIDVKDKEMVETILLMVSIKTAF
jgi:hypothetical protein